MGDNKQEEVSNIVHGYIRRYNNCMHKIIQLSPSSIAYLFYLAEQADDECIISVSRREREQFITFISNMSNKKIEYKDVTIKKALQQLKDLNFLLPTKDRGYLYVNPLYFYNGRSAKRLNMIKYINRKVEELKEMKEYINGTPA